jgi:hypothetical protein
MKPDIGRWLGALGLLAGATTSLALGGCAAEVDTEGEQVAARSDGLEFSDSVYDGKNGSPTQCTVDGVTMHCCPSGRLMTGANLNANVFKCTSTHSPGIIRTPFIDGPDSSTHTVTQRSGMHACPNQTVMLGFHRARNDLLCVGLSLENPLFEIVDGGTQDPAMPGHVCPANGSPPFFTGRAMSGIRDDQNKFLCAE